MFEGCDRAEPLGLVVFPSVNQDKFPLELAECSGANCSTKRSIKHR